MARPFHWFQGASVHALTDALVAAGQDARLEVHQHGDKWDCPECDREAWESGE